jgi:hypothetical protein
MTKLRIIKTKGPNPKYVIQIRTFLFWRLYRFNSFFGPRSKDAIYSNFDHAKADLKVILLRFTSKPPEKLKGSSTLIEVDLRNVSDEIFKD